MPPLDLAKTDAVFALLAVPRDGRDDAWRGQFFAAIVDASLASPADQVLRGPDGFPYFVLTRPPVAQPFTALSVSHILGHCTMSGLGIVIEPSDQGPEWVFTYGDLFALRAYGSFEGDPLDRDAPDGPKNDVLEKDRAVMIGAPSEEFLPAWARRVLGAFLKSAAGIDEPKVLVLVDPTRAPSRNLVFNVHPEGFESKAGFERVMNALGWFMPHKRSCIAVSRNALDPASFQPL